MSPPYPADSAVASRCESASDGAAGYVHFLFSGRLATGPQFTAKAIAFFDRASYRGGVMAAFTSYAATSSPL